MKNTLLILLLTMISISSQAQFINFTFDDSSYRSFIFIDTVNYHNNIWQVGKPYKSVFNAAYSSPGAIVTDTLLPYRANDTSVFILKVPKYWSTIGAMPLIYDLQFWYQLSLDSNAKAMIEFSGDAGLTWKDLLKDSTDYLDWSLGGVGKPDFDTSTHGWKWFNVASFDFRNGSALDTTLFRFTFLSGSNDSGKDGWIIDNMQMEYYSEGIVHIVRENGLISISPNPATTSLTISSPEKITTVAITNLLGQVVYTHEYNSQQVEVNVAGFPTGVYFVKVNGADVRRFVKQ